MATVGIIGLGYVGLPLAVAFAQEGCEGIAVAFQAVIYKGSPLAMYTLDRTGHVLTWNPAAEALYGWRAEEVLGRSAPTASLTWGRSSKRRARSPRC